MKKSILILGVNGFIGNALIRSLLLDNKYEVFGMDLFKNNLEDLLEKKNFTFFEGDINIGNEWIEYHIKKCDVIIPLVAIATPNVYVKEPLKIFELDFESNLKIVKWVAKYGKHIIFPSSSEVYGMSNDKKFNEYKTNLMVGPVDKSRWIYSISKQLLDRVIIAHGNQNNLTYTLFRPFNWIGPKLDSLKNAQLGNGRVITIFINNLLNNNNLIIVGSGKQTRSFTYIDDGIDALKKIIENKKNKLNKKIINIGNPNNNVSIEFLAKKIVEIYKKKYPKKYKGKIIFKTQKVFYGDGYEDIPVRVPDISEARKLLNWKPKYNLEKSLYKTLEYYTSKQ